MLDILTLLMIAFGIFNGWRLGLLNTILSLARYVLSIFVARLISPQITEFIVSQTKIGDWVDKLVGDMINNAMESELAGGFISGVASETIINLICFAIIFFISVILLTKLMKIGLAINKIPLIGGINKFGGMIAGLVKSFILIFIILSFTYFLVNFAGKDQLGEKIEQTILVDALYENNPIVGFIKEMLEIENTPPSSV